MSLKHFLPPILVVTGLAVLTALAATTQHRADRPGLTDQTVVSIQAAAADIDRHLHSVWESQGLSPAVQAQELTVLRRLSLALHGTVPSLEEIRRFEADEAPHRLARWTAAMLEDNRFVDYFAERLARAYVGVEGGQFVIFRRDRFTEWIREQLREHRPYDAMVREMISGQGVWTGKGEVNFLTAAYANGEFDPNKLTARTVRAFLGQRMDCAQCHDHPFDSWTQDQFEGLSAHFRQIDLTLMGVHDQQTRQFDPSVPFHPEWLGRAGSRRDQLAVWVTHPENVRFDRAIANRVWGVMFGRPFLTDRPVDDLPSPEQTEYAEDTKVLDLLGRDFRKHGCDLRRLIQVIAATQSFRMASRTDVEAANVPVQEENWAIFPLVRLRPEQVIGSMLQANSVKTIDQNSHLFVRFRKYVRENDFVREFGDPGENELTDRSGTIPQALLRMNGEFAHEMSAEGPLGAPSRLAGFSPTNESFLENAFLACLTRRLTQSELDHFLPQLDRNDEQSEGVVEDLFWTLFNSPEFSWNH